MRACIGQPTNWYSTGASQIELIFQRHDQLLDGYDFVDPVSIGSCKGETIFQFPFSCTSQSQGNTVGTFGAITGFDTVIRTSEGCFVTVIHFS
jgi:hypothetical protein